jgi:RimJ/RimL family protein N-acetyltransferase
MPPPGREILVAVKESAGARGSALSLQVGQPIEAVLRPVATRIEGLSAEDVRVLTEWRNRHVRAFLTEFEADESRTRRWLTETVGPDDSRILFMVDAADGRTIGYLGLAFIDWEHGSAEADAVVRGVETLPGVMTKALRTLLGWARGQLGLASLGVRVRSDNPALAFYCAFGFREVRRVPLRGVCKVDMLRWTEDPSLPSGEPTLVHMTLPTGHCARS